MNHQFFRDWLVTEEPLTQEQAQMLEDHMKECLSCSQIRTAWSEVQRLIKVTPDVEPPTGFTTRWEQRMVRQHKQAENRLTWMVFASLTSVAFLVMILLGLQFFELVRSPEQIALVLVSRFAALLSYLSITKSYLSFFSAYLPTVSFPVIIFSIGFLTLLCVLWLAAMKQISSGWRIVK